MTRLFPTFLACVLLILGARAWGDPRMETNDNFCHFILDEANTDNEVFLAGCNPTITVDDDAGTASGYALAWKRLPLGKVPTTKFEGSSTSSPCNFVDSNGTEYTTQTWRSRTAVYGPKKSPSNPPLDARLVSVKFELYCIDAQAN